VDAIVDLTETGSTLRRNGMEIVDVLLESRTQLIANTASYADESKKKAIDELTLLLKGAISARGKVLLKLNIDRARLDAVVAALPAMRAPTVSELAVSDYFAVETIVSKATVNTLIPLLKDLGAEDIVELPVAKIVP
jgi:ATP phosphoribosyltransferase